MAKYPVDPSIAAAGHFWQSQRVTEVKPHGTGNVNLTFQVTTCDNKKFILQRLNGEVFPQPKLIMDNLRIISDHLKGKEGPGIAAIIQTLDGKDFYIDPQGSLWRAQEFIANTCPSATIVNLDQARQAGTIVGRFHRLIADIDISKLHDTLPGFHITPEYLQIYDAVKDKTPPAQMPDIDYCREFIAVRRDQAAVLEEAKAAGKLRLRPIHGDPKLANIMFAKASGQAICLIDLDTVKPGLIHYDIGDLLRSACNLAAEDTCDPTKIIFDLDICQAIVTGYINAAQSILTDNDILYLQPAIRLLPFELGLRFFSDYLAGNIYFHCRHPQQNLHRAINQFLLLADIEKKQADIAAICQQASTRTCGKGHIKRTYT